MTGMRVIVKFLDAGGDPSEDADLLTTLQGNPNVGNKITFNTLTYSVESVEWNGNPQPMRASDLTITVKPV